MQKNINPMKKIFLYILLFIWQSTQSPAQTYSVIRQIGYEQGLPNNYILGITQDKRGYLWFATEEGLSRYDGVHFVNYLNTSPGILRPSGKGLSCVLDDKTDPCLWFGTQTEGLNCYNYENNTFKVYKHKDKKQESLADNSITDIHPARNGNLWISTYNKGVDYFDKKSKRFIHYNSRTLSGNFCDNVWTCAESNGFLYIGHEKHGLSILNLKSRTFINYTARPGNPNSLPGNTVRGICTDSRGQVWLATDKGLAVFDPSTNRFRKFTYPGQSITQNCYNVEQINADEVWVAPEFGGAVAVNIHTYQTSPVQTTYAQGLYNNWQKLSDQSLRYIYKDKYGNIWLGSWSHGIFMIEHAQPLFRHYLYSAIPSDNFLTNPSVMSVTADLQNNLYIGTDGGGINIFNGNKRTSVYKQQHPGIEDNCMQAALRDSKGNLWFGLYYAGILTFKRGSEQAVQVYSPDRKTTDVRAFYEDIRSGVIYVATSQGLDLFQRDSHQLIRHINLPNNLARSVIKDKNGNIWIGTFNGGIFILSPDGQVIKVLNKKNNLPDNSISQLYQDSKGHIWAGTSEGLLCFSGSNLSGKYIVYNQKDGLDNTFIRSIIEDNKKRIWVSTNQSLCMLAPDNHFLCYNSVDGRPFGNFTDRSTFIDKEGRLYFGSIDGLYSFNPEELFRKQMLPPVMISELTISGAASHEGMTDKEVFISPWKTVKLKHTENTFTVTFNTSDFACTNRVEYIYKLKGLDNTWYSSKGSNTTTYRNLPPGKYTFIVKAYAKNQESYSKEASLDIDIAPPFYAGWWAKLFYILIAAGIIWWLLHIYKKRIHLEYLYASERKSHRQELELNEERLQFYTNITHELRTPLTLIIGPIEDVEKSAALNDKDRHTVSIIHRSALRLLRLINELLEFRKTETGNRHLRIVKGDIVRTIRETGLKYMELLRNPNVKFIVELPQFPVEMNYDPEVITIILDNLISNAVKYTMAGSITLSASIIPDNLFEIKVKDTGYGISPDALQHIFDRYYQEKSDHQASGTGIGLALVKNLVNLHEGHIAVTSEEGKGTCFSLTIGIDKTYPNAIHVKQQLSTPVIDPIQDSSPQKDEKKNYHQSGNKPVVLIVEDNPDILSYIADALTDDYIIRTAENGKQGKDTALKIMPDIIVSDILMPEMNGYDMCKELKANVSTSHIPVILLTARTSMEDKMEGYEVGADSYITKPFSAVLLKSRIDNLITQRKTLFAQINPLLKAGKKAMEEKRSTFEKSLSQLDRDFLKKLDSLIQENLKSNKLDINFLAGQMFMSNSTLYRKMKALTGLSTKEYISRMRMKKAEELLLKGELSISEIADETGWDNTGYFRQCFKKEFGISPSEYLKKVKEQD